MNQDTEAIYLLSPLPHIVDCLMADLDRRRYKRAHLVWTSRTCHLRLRLLFLPGTLTCCTVLDGRLRKRLDSTSSAREQIAGFRVLSVDFFPRESHLITFRDPWSFPILFHPSCSNLVRDHMQSLSQKVRCR